MTISVIIPTYRPKDYIKECLQSLESQTLDKESFEVLIVLNGDKEPYYSYINNLLNSYSFHNRLLYTEQSGVSHARNIGLDNAVGDYICFIDDDDYVSSVYLEELLSVSSPDSIAYARMVSFDDETKAIQNNPIRQYFEAREQLHKFHLLKGYRLLTLLCSACISKSVIGNKRFNTTFKNGEDTLFVFYISSNINSIVLTTREATYYRRIRNDSAHYCHKPLGYWFSNYSRLMYCVTAYYLQNITKYNLLFFLIRICSYIKGFVNKIL